MYLRSLVKALHHGDCCSIGKSVLTLSKNNLSQVLRPAISSHLNVNHYANMAKSVNLSPLSLLIKASKTVLSLAGLLLGHFFARDNKIILFGDFNNVAADSYEYFLESPESFYVTANHSLVDNKRIVHRWSLRGLYLAIKAGTYVVNCYAGDINPFFFHGARLINIWHGIPLKDIEVPDKIEYYMSEYFFAKALSHKLAMIDVFVIPCDELTDFFESRFQFRVRRFVHGATHRYFQVKNFLAPRSGASLYLSSLDNPSEFPALLSSLNDFLGCKLSPVLHPKDRHLVPLDDKLEKSFARPASPDNIIIYESSLIEHAPTGSLFVASTATKLIRIPSYLSLVRSSARFNLYVKIVEHKQRQKFLELEELLTIPQ